MAIQELDDDTKMDGGCSLKVVIGGASSHVEAVVKLPSNVIEVEFSESKGESRCENGVCSLTWKPRRIA